MGNTGVEIRTGDVVELRKPHPCGANAWEIVRAGMDVRLRCLACKRTIELGRADFERRYKKHAGSAGDDDAR